MKHIRYLNTFLTFIGLLFVGWLSFVHVDWLLLDAIFTYIFGYLLLFICLTPAGNIVLGSREPLPSLNWFIKLLKGQAVLLIITICAYVAFFNGGPSFATGGISLSFAQGTITDYTAWQWGIFPWGLHGVWALTLAYLVYLKKGEPFYYQLARGLCSKRFEPMIKTFVEGTVSGSTIMAMTLWATAVILSLCYGINIILNIDYFAMPVLTFMIVSFFAPLISFKWGRKFFNKLTIRKKAYASLYLFMIIAMLVFLIVSGFANNWFIHKYPQIYKLQCQQCGNYFANVPQELRFAALYWGWWVIWTPFAGAYLAVISQGRTLREFVIGLFLVPALLILIYLKWGATPFSHIFVYIQQGASMVSGDLQAANALLYISLGLLTGLILIFTLKDFKDTGVLHTGMMPISEDVKVSRLWLKDAPRIQGVSKMAQKLSLAIVGTIFIHTMAGWYGIQLEVAAMGLLLINVAYTGFHFLMIRFIKDRVWLGNQNIPPFSNKDG